MRKLVLMITLVLGVMVSAQPVTAGRTATATGTFTVLTEDYTFLGTVGSDSYFAGVLTLQYAGGLSGLAGDGDTFVVHEDGTFEGRGIEVCTSCTLGGRTGDFVAAFEVSGGPSFTEFTGTLRFICGAGGLAGLRGGGTFVGTAAGNTYSYSYRFTRVRGASSCARADADRD